MNDPGQPMSPDDEFRRLAVALSATGALVLVFFRETVLGTPLAGLCDAWAGSTFWLLERLGVDVVQTGSVLSQPGGFAMAIGYPCAGLLTSVCLTAAILAARAGVGLKLSGVVVGVTLLALLNQVRLMHLFWLGVSESQAFDLAHRLLWPGANIVIVLALWWMWRAWAGARTSLKTVHVAPA